MHIYWGRGYFEGVKNLLMIGTEGGSFFQLLINKIKSCKQRRD